MSDTVRRVIAGDLGVHWNTAARAYSRLHARPSTRVPALLREAVTEARLAGMTREGLRAALESEFESWEWKQ